MRTIDAWELDSCEWLHLTALAEPGNNTLTLWVEEAKPNPGGSIEPLRMSGEIGERVQNFLRGAIPIEHTSDCRKFVIRWTDYIAFAVLNESYAAGDKKDTYSGGNFRLYKESQFLSFVRGATFASDDYPGPYSHFGIVCGHHVIEEAAEHPPIVEVVEMGDPWQGD